MRFPRQLFGTGQKADVSVAHGSMSAEDRGGGRRWRCPWV